MVSEESSLDRYPVDVVEAKLVVEGESTPFNYRARYMYCNSQSWSNSPVLVTEFSSIAWRTTNCGRQMVDEPIPIHEENGSADLIGTGSFIKRSRDR